MRHRLSIMAVAAVLFATASQAAEPQVKISPPVEAHCSAPLILVYLRITAYVIVPRCVMPGDLRGVE